MDIELNEIVDKVILKVSGWLDAFISMLPNMAVAIILLIAFVLLGKLASKIFRRVAKKVTDNQALINLFSTITLYTVLGLGIFIVLSILQLEKTVTSLLAGIGILGLALGFAFQDIAANFVSGIILVFRKPFNVDDVIHVNDITGMVSRTNLRVTVIETFQGQEVYIPNKDVLQNPITNYSALGKRRIDLVVGVSYGDNLEKVRTLVLDAIKGVNGVIDHDNMVFNYGEFASSSINFTIRFWIKYPGDPSILIVLNDAIMAIKNAFDENNITIPFPIRTLDFGIKGGEKLSEMPLLTAQADAVNNKSSQN